MSGGPFRKTNVSVTDATIRKPLEKSAAGVVAWPLI
jgi:hypothetical protein